ncbi:MAG: hypothetical protein HYZ37_03070 [Candidatus Solibacter usitatus]|nr:hypothetical protein [Candidatus Solibacter usitatus]
MKSRRAFLASSAVALAPAAMGALKLPRKIRLALLDLEGHVEEVIRPLADLPDVEVVAIAHPDEKAVAQRKRNPRLAAAKYYSDWRRMLDEEKLDMVSSTGRISH